MRTATYRSWGRYPDARQRAIKLRWRGDPLPLEAGSTGTVLPYGNGRSYGDSCLNDGGTVIDCRGLNRFIDFDVTTGRLRCEGGMLLSDILAHCVPRDWFLPVTPGTRFVTVGGAIANDVHGKNHHRAGTFGTHVHGFELLRSDGTRRFCSTGENHEWYRATIGGLGLTGVITWAEIQLQPVASAYIDEEIIRFSRLGEFFRLVSESDEAFEHTVAWIDCLARGRALGRGRFIRGNHAPPSAAPEIRALGRTPLRIPLDPPFSMIGKLSVRIGNSVYYRLSPSTPRRARTHYTKFFYPLDAIDNWNHIYGRNGFLQYQCVVPAADAETAIIEMLERISMAGAGSFLSVLKSFGETEGPGLLSFARPGVTLALDFPNRGDQTLALLDRLDEVTMAAGGAVYPAKDARMSPACFQAGFTRWRELEHYVDPRFSSSFWRRVTREPT